MRTGRSCRGVLGGAGLGPGDRLQVSDFLVAGGQRMTVKSTHEFLGS